MQKVSGFETRLAMRESETVLTKEHRKHLLELGRDLDFVWDHPQCPVHLKKRILRTVIREIIVTEDEDPGGILMTIHWFGGGHTHVAVNRRTQGQHDNGNTQEVIALVKELAAVCNDVAIVAVLNRSGYRTGTGNTWTESRVQHVRHTNEIPACQPGADRPWLTMSQAAEDSR